MYLSGSAVNTDTSPTLENLLEPTKVSLDFVNSPNLAPIQPHGFLFSALNTYHKLTLEGTIYALPGILNVPPSRNFYVGIPGHPQAYLVKKVLLEEGKFYVTDREMLDPYLAE